MTPKVPNALLHGHENLTLEIKDLINKSGKIGEISQILNKKLHDHFLKEEKYALPPLGLLLALSEGNWKIDKDEAIKMADTLQSNFAEMTQEHQDISKTLNELKIVAEQEDDFFTKQFVENLTLHVELEDQVLYPATILIGNYLKNKSTMN